MIVKSVNASTGNNDDDEFASDPDAEENMEFDVPFQVPDLPGLQVDANGNFNDVPGANAAMAVVAHAAVIDHGPAGDGGDPPAVVNGGVPPVVVNGGGPPAAAGDGRGGAPPAAAAVSRTFTNNVNNLRASRGGRSVAVGGTSASTGGFSFDNVMSMMMMQQQMEREDRRADAELRRY